MDLLFPADEPAVSGVKTAQDVEIEPGLKVKVFSLVMLTLSRSYSDQPRDRADLYMLYERRLLLGEEVMDILEEYDPEMAIGFQKLMEEMARLQRQKRPPRRWGRTSEI